MNMRTVWENSHSVTVERNPETGMAKITFLQGDMLFPSKRVEINVYAGDTSGIIETSLAPSAPPLR